MTSTETGRENPFPASAVTTFGLRAPVIASFSYMFRAREYVVSYLTRFPHSGAALALSGGHGSGKTYLLDWLSNEAASIAKQRITTIYAKADNQSLPDVYRQFMRSVTRPALIEVTNAAVRNIGKRVAGSAQATERTSVEIESAGTLQPGFDAKIFDADELYLILKAELEAIGVSPAISLQIAYAVGILDHPQFGEPAFVWLSGGKAELPKEMPVRGPLWSEDSVDAGDIAVSALECIAGLYRLAESPLMFILDQVENFIPRKEHAAAGASLLKKLTEQISGQGALLLIAGTPPAWERLPRDVSPRLLTRAPIIVGGLSNDECALLLKAYLQQGSGFGPEAGIMIRDLSGGGNAREILQIAHRVFEKTGGAVESASPDDLVQAARDSGSLQDRAKLALQMIDAAAEQLNFKAAAAATKQGQTIDRWVTGPQGANLAIVLLTSPDARSEAEDARKLTELRRNLASEPAQAELLVVAIGYSSERVRSLVGEISNVLVFDEIKFQQEVDAACRYLSVAAAPKARSEAPEIDRLMAQLSRLDDRLARIETNRVEAEHQTATILQEGTEELAKAERVQAEAKTRHELRFGLDELHEALFADYVGDERRILRRLLIANEANVKDKTFDYLGTIYLDALDSLQLSDALRYDGPASAIATEYKLLRSSLIREMRKKLSSWNESNFDVRSPAISSILLGLMTALLTGGIIFINLVRFMTDATALNLALAIGVVTGFVAGMFWLLFSETLKRPDRRYHRFAMQLSELRATAQKNTYDRTP